MGAIRISIKLSNPLKENLAPNETTALVDTGSINLCLPKYLAIRLGLQELEKRNVVVADGRMVNCSYSGPVLVEFDDRKCYTGALILGDEVILGTIPLEDMDLMIHPASQSVKPNPEVPELPTVMNPDCI
ncbi:MAG: clan AA aspartic protease [Proteobacteria bacterium]|nr:clan AA aspartic protease [Pseudomonadota bacterium]